jgi:hypothetical protein
MSMLLAQQIVSPTVEAILIHEGSQIVLPTCDEHTLGDLKPIRASQTHDHHPTARRFCQKQIFRMSYPVWILAGDRSATPDEGYIARRRNQPPGVHSLWPGWASLGFWVA